MKRPPLIRTYVLAACSLIPALCQISQNRPELCGGSGGFVAVPPDLSVIFNKPSGTATFRLGSSHSVALNGVNNEIHQVCPLSSDRLVSFGWNFVGYTLNVIDLRRAVVLDSFLADDPVISPNQHWIASRRLNPPQSEIKISEEYLLYDLSASASENRHSVAPSAIDDLGWAMYPAFPNGAPVDLLDVPEANKHEWRSKSFFWAPDSQSLVFADRVGDNLSLVLVIIKSNKPQAYTHPVSGTEVCSGPGQADSDLMLKDASISSASNGAPSVFATFDDSDSGCRTRPVTLTFDDFRAAPVESFEHRKLKQSTPR